MHHSASILSIGDELAIGQKLDTNGQWIAEALTLRGIIVREHVTIADDLDHHVETIRRLAARTPLLISTGGLGPTSDDLTREALARVMGEPLVEDVEALAHVRSIMEKRGRELTDLQRAQALRPRSARCLANVNGTAPGLWGRVSDCDVVCLPGPPSEMKPMFDRLVSPELRPPVGSVVRTRVLHCLGIGEGDLAKRLGALMMRDRNPLVGTTASGGVVSIRIRYQGPEGPDAEMMRETETLARRAADPFVFGDEQQTIESVILDLLRERGDRLVVAESCTAGGLGAMVSRTPGSSAALLGGWITYSDAMKSALLSVPRAMLESYGAVSAEVAQHMAEGALRHSHEVGGAQHALAISGIAGPDGGSEQKPVGTVFIALASADLGSGKPRIDSRRFLITGGRNEIRDRAARLALMMLRFRLLSIEAPRTLWQMRLDGSPMGP